MKEIISIDSKLREKEIQDLLREIGLYPIKDFKNIHRGKELDTLREYNEWVKEQFFPEINNKILKVKFGDK